MFVARHFVRLLGLALIASTGVVAVALPRRADGAATIVVNTVADEDVDNASCSLREAIIAANTNTSHNGCAAVGAGVNDQIVFDLGPDTSTINIGSTPLPKITEWVTIDGAKRVELHGPGGPLVSGHHGLEVVHEGFGTIIRNLVINNFADDGIFINADEVYVFGCYIGTDATGTMGVPNAGFGVQVFGGNGVRIGGATSGGACTGDCNVISAAMPQKANVLLDLNSMNALVQGNFIGTDVTGTAAVTPSVTIGIIDKGHGNRIGGMGGTTPGGPCTGDCNLISGNTNAGGVWIDQAATGSVLQGNFIGTDVTGNVAVVGTAGAIGIFSFALGVTIGGTTPEARNVVSGNPYLGIEVAGLNAIVQGNYFGTNAAGTAAVPGTGPAILVYETDGAMIGGTAPGAGNLISGASSIFGYGVAVGHSTNTRILGNLIGTAADGTTPVPNFGHAVIIKDEASNNVVGSGVAGAANVIAFNGGDGVQVDGEMPTVRSNTIRGNSIYSNGGAGISLLSGANDGLAPPTIDGLDPLHGTACAPCEVDIFSDAEDEGRIHEGSVFTNDGNWTFEAPVTGPHITATNTDMSGNTSQFAAPVSLPSATPTLSPTVSSSPSSTHTPTRTRTRTPVPSQTATKTATGAATATSTRTAVATPTRTATTNATQTITATTNATQTITATSNATRTITATSNATQTITATSNATQTITATSNATQTITATTNATQTITATGSINPTPTPTPAPCTGDCNADGVVSIDELITGVNIALAALPVSACPAFENSQGEVAIAQLISAVNHALNGCVPSRSQGLS